MRVKYKLRLPYLFELPCCVGDKFYGQSLILAACYALFKGNQSKGEAMK